MSGQFHAPAALSPGKEPPVPIGYEVGWTPEPVWTTWRSKNSSPHRDSNSDPLVVKAVASRYTDYSIPALTGKCTFCNESKWEVFLRLALAGHTGIFTEKHERHLK
jgi:hypothetical protein